MSQEIEIEFNNLLTKQEFEHLLTAFPFPTEGTEQVNHYFETTHLDLSKKLSALRIREKNNSYTLTLKEPHVEGLLETHVTLNEVEASDSINKTLVEKDLIVNQLTNLGINLKDLKYFGALTTIRREIKYGDVLLVLDYSTYNRKHDYEFELEAPDYNTGLAQFNSILTQHNITKKETPNKIERFFSSLNK